MNATYTQRRNTTITRLVPFALALMLSVASLATTGCDTLDSNAIEDEPYPALFSSKSGEPHRLADQHFAEAAPSAFGGTWQRVSENAAQADRVTFFTSAKQDEGRRIIGQFSGETTCSDFSGDFRANDPNLDINMLNVAATRCTVFVEEEVISVLRAATAYTFDEDLLLIFAGKNTPALVLKRVETDDDANQDGGEPEIIGPPTPADDEPHVLGPPEDADDKPQVLGPPVPTDGGK